MEVSEPRSQEYRVQRCDGQDWWTVDKHTYYVDAVVCLGQRVESDPESDHRVLRVTFETAIEVPSIETEKLP
jgi:hypothetical protein